MSSAPPSDSYAYLDTSAFVKLCWPEAESAALSRYLRRWPRRASAALLWTEALRAAQRRPGARLDRAQRLLRRIAIIQVDLDLFRQAGLLGPPTMRSLDAIHLASAVSLGTDLGVLICYDERLVAAAASLGLPVAAPA
jgi:uncharacterized protein